MRTAVSGRFTVALAVMLAAAGCAAHHPQAKGNPDYDITPVPTVPKHTKAPGTEATPVPVRGAGTHIKAKKGQLIGPVITFFGAAKADGSTVQPISVDHGIPTYRSAVGSGFIIVVEAKPGPSGLEPGRSIFSYDPKDPKKRPDLQIETSRDMGNGSRAVCDRTRPNIGGIPAVNPASFKVSQRVSDALNDFGCRFEIFNDPEGSCTLGKNGDYAFVSSDTTQQYCMVVARAYLFPEGETTLTVRTLDTEGNPGPPKQMRILRPPKGQMAAPTRK